MTDHDTKQDHPGSDWVEILGREGYHTRFFHPGLRHVVIWNDQSKADESRAEAVARCRAISNAALTWERRKAEATGIADQSYHLAELANAWGKKL